MKKYCFNCGGKMEFSAANKPKFCPNCGTPLESSANPQEVQNTTIEEDDDIDSVLTDLSIEALDFEFDSSLTQVKGQKIGSVVGTLDGSQISNYKPPKQTKTADGNFKEEFRKEAGSLKQNKLTEEDAS
tara:strand:- start:7086 stop:7472 length:387 start_codon:yes stop_codon:yes gene_type:complete